MANVNRAQKIPKAESDTKSQNRRKRQLVGNNDHRGVSLTDVPESVRSVAASQMIQIQILPNQNIVGAIQKMEDSRQVSDNVQILLKEIGDCKNQITAVSRRWNEELQRRGDFSGENGRGLRKMQWHDF